jgi:hypothetical protein
MWDGVGFEHGDRARGEKYANMQVMMQFFELIKEDTRVIDYMKTFLERTDRKAGEKVTGT